jgi:hypothetical protein
MPPAIMRDENDLICAVLLGLHSCRSHIPEGFRQPFFAFKSDSIILLKIVLAIH